MSDTYVLYHGNCYDGFGAAYAAWRVFGDDATYIPVVYGQPFPPEVPVGATVYILDFSYPRDELIEHHGWSKKLVVLDHHATARDALTRIARDLAYLVYHPHRSDHSEAGWPDLAMVRCNAAYGPPRFVVAELKRESDGTRKTELTRMQEHWRDALIDAGVEWHLWRPSDLLSGRVFEILRGDVCPR